MKSRLVAVLVVVATALALLGAPGVFPGAVPRFPFQSSGVGASRTSTPLGQGAPEGFQFVPSANLSYRTLDHRVAWLPSLASFAGPGLLLTNYPYASSPSVAVAMATPAPIGGLPVYDYGTGTTRNLTFPWSMGGAFYPGGVTIVSSPAGTFLYTLSPKGFGVSGSVQYRNQDAQIVVSGLLDVPGFRHLDAINLTVPLTQLGYVWDETIGLQYGAYLAGTNLTAYAFVSHLTGSGHFWTAEPPWAKFLYTADLSSPAFLDVTKPHAVAPRWQIPWDAPLDGGYIQQVVPNLILGVLWGPQPGNIQLYDPWLGAWKNFTAPGRYPMWHEVRGTYLYLLMDNTENGTAYDYLLNRIDLSALADFPYVASNPVQTLWERVFPRPISNDYVVPVVHGDRVDVFDGINGYVSYDTPHLNTVYELDFLSGNVLSRTNVSSNVGLVNGPMYGSDFPALDAIPLFNGYVADLDNRLVFPTDLAVLEPPCGDCVSAAYLTRYEFPVLDFLVEQQATLGLFASSPVSNLTVVEIRANYTLPTPASPNPPVSGPGGGSADALILTVALVVGTLGSVAAVVLIAVAAGSRRERAKPPRTPPAG